MSATASRVRRERPRAPPNTGLPACIPLLHPGLPGEGVWHATRPGLALNPPVLLTTIRNQPEYPRVVAGLAWINTKRTKISLHPGRLEPSVELPRGEMQVPSWERHSLLATFNSGFKLADPKAASSWMVIPTRPCITARAQSWATRTGGST